MKVVSQPRQENENGKNVFIVMKKNEHFDMLRRYFFVAKGQIKPKAVWARRRFSQKMNKRICFVCREKQKSKQNKFIPSFFGRIYGASICFWFYLTFILDQLK
jgi:hypothetical protein